MTVEPHIPGRAGWLVGFGTGLGVGVLAMDFIRAGGPVVAVLALVAMGTVLIGRARYREAIDDA